MLGFVLGNRDDVAGHGVRNVAIEGMVAFRRLRIFRNVQRLTGTRGRDDILRLRGIRTAIIARKSDHIACGGLVERDGWVIDAVLRTQQHQPRLDEGCQVAADGQQKRRLFRSVGRSFAIGTRGCDGEAPILQTEQVRVTQGFESDVDTGHHRAISYGVAGGPRAIEWFGAEAYGGSARAARALSGCRNRYAGGEEDAIVFIQRFPFAGDLGTQRKVHAIGDVLVVRLFTTGGCTRVTQQSIVGRHGTPLQWTIHLQRCTIAHITTLYKLTSSPPSRREHPR